MGFVGSVTGTFNGGGAEYKSNEAWINHSATLDFTAYETSACKNMERSGKCGYFQSEELTVSQDIEKSPGKIDFTSFFLHTIL